MKNNYSFVAKAIPESTIVGPITEIHIVQFLEGYGKEVAIPIENPMDTSHVVISREAKRFVNDIHDHREEIQFNICTTYACNIVWMIF